MAIAIKSTEIMALVELVRSISEGYIAPGGWKNNVWQGVDETKKIKVPALYV